VNKILRIFKTKYIWLAFLFKVLYFFILLATVSGDFSFVNAYCVFTVVGFHCNSFDTWCDEIVSWVK